ncbi:MAG: DUF1269 domain-containing protein [Nocardioidaceae bacterium]
MATLTVWTFDTPGGAIEASTTLRELAREGVVVVHDAATVSWERAAQKPSIRPLGGSTDAGLPCGSFWGLLFGLIFLVPLLGAAIGAATGAVAGCLTDVGIDDTFINKVRDRVTPGTSALFVLSPEPAMDTIEPAFAVHQPVGLILATLSDEQEEAIRRVFTE